MVANMKQSLVVNIHSYEDSLLCFLSCDLCRQIMDTKTDLSKPISGLNVRMLKKQ